jgi:hypothetical protein
MNQILVAKNLNDTIGNVLVTDVNAIQVRYRKIAIVTGCESIFLSNRCSTSSFTIKTPVATIKSGSVGRFKSMPKVGKKSRSGIERGVKNAMIKRTESSE